MGSTKIINIIIIVNNLNNQVDVYWNKERDINPEKNLDQLGFEPRTFWLVRCSINWATGARLRRSISYTRFWSLVKCSINWAPGARSRKNISWTRSWSLVRCSINWATGAKHVIDNVYYLGTGKFSWVSLLKLFHWSIYSLIYYFVNLTQHWNKHEKGWKRKVKNAGSHWRLNPGPLTSATSALTTKLQQPDNHQHFTILYILHKWYWMLHSCTRQLFSSFSLIQFSIQLFVGVCKTDYILSNNI